MKGFPTTLSSKEDYLYIKNNFPADKWKPVWQSLIDSLKDWINVGEIDPLDGIEDETHKVVEQLETGDEKKAVYYQFELRENPTCKLHQLGFTVEEVEDALTEG